MGGFAGGDEGGYWDVDTITGEVDKLNNTTSKNLNKNKPYIKTSDSAYSIKVKEVEGLCNTISFVVCKCDTFSIEGCDEVPLEANGIYKAYNALYKYTNDSDIIDFFFEYKVVVSKDISLKDNERVTSLDAAAFLYLLKEACNLVLSTEELVRIASAIGADIDYFNY